MGSHRAAALLSALFLLGCEHSSPASAAVDRHVGPWQPGTPSQLSASPVNIIGLSQDGDQVLFTRRNYIPQTDPDGGRSTKDTSDVCLGLMPAIGGSGTYLDCDRRLGQLDSMSWLVTAAADGQGRILSVVSRGPIDTYSAVLEHVELYLSNQRDRGARRQLMTLYRDALGRAVVPRGTLNWLRNLAWLDQDHFTALGYYNHPGLGLRLEYLGIVVGTIGPDSATATILTNQEHPSQILGGPDGTILLTYPPDKVVAIGAADGEERWTSRLPPASGPGRQLVGLGCPPGGCVAVSFSYPDRLLQRWSIGPGHPEAVPGRQDNFYEPIHTLFVSARDGALIFLTGDGLFRLE